MKATDVKPREYLAALADDIEGACMAAGNRGAAFVKISVFDMMRLATNLRRIKEYHKEKP